MGNQRGGLTHGHTHSAMAKHSKNNCSKSYHTHAEKKAMGYGSKQVRLGKDSLIQFGMCGLTLQPLQNPVCTPKGHLFSRDAIVEHLAMQKIALKKQERKFQKQEREKACEEQIQQQKDHEAALEAWE